MSRDILYSKKITQITFIALRRGYYIKVILKREKGTKII